jgi:hypothetical protein
MWLHSNEGRSGDPMATSTGQGASAMKRRTVRPPWWPARPQSQITVTRLSVAPSSERHSQCHRLRTVELTPSRVLDSYRVELLITDVASCRRSKHPTPAVSCACRDGINSYRDMPAHGWQPVSPSHPKSVLADPGPMLDQLMPTDASSRSRPTSGHDRSGRGPGVATSRRAWSRGDGGRPTSLSTIPW